MVRKSETGEDDSKLYDLFSAHQAEGKTYVMLNMPSGDISEIKYLLPLVGNFIDGYYDIADIRFGQRTKHFAENGITIPVKLPTLKIKIGQYHSFDKTYTNCIVPRMSNQIWTPDYLKSVLDKSSDETDIASEPEAEYGYTEPAEWDYIDE